MEMPDDCLCILMGKGMVTGQEGQIDLTVNMFCVKYRESTCRHPEPLKQYQVIKFH